MRGVSHGAARLALRRVAPSLLSRDPWRMGWRRFAFGGAVVLAVACSSESGPGPEHDAGADVTTGGATAGGTGGTLGVGGTGATSTGGSASGGSANGGTGGDDGCLPECFAPTRCVKLCGDVPEDYGCCPCPQGYVDVLTCPDAG